MNKDNPLYQEMYDSAMEAVRQGRASVVGTVHGTHVTFSHGTSMTFQAHGTPLPKPYALKRKYR